MISAKSDVQVDTPEVRVTEWRLAPGSATGHHTHEMDYVIVPVTSGEMTIVAPNGDRSKAQLGIGKSYFRKAGVQHDVLNETASEMTAMLDTMTSSVSSRSVIRLIRCIQPMNRSRPMV